MTLSVFSDEQFMKEALKEAQKAFDADEVPVGAVIVCNNKIIARAHNLTERLNDVTAHAEMQAFTSAANHIGGKYLNECTLYVTIEPCVMCAGASYWTQIGKVVYGAKDPKKGFLTHLTHQMTASHLMSSPILHPKTKLVGGILQEECAELMIRFFEKKRE